MKIEDLIAGKNEQEEINVEGITLPVSGLKKCMKEGYIHLRPYKEEKTVSLWGKTCTGCFTVQDLREKGSQN
ncbi:MAG: hypothetical protein JJE15_03680 [Desulfobacteraceae bacterium]|nr:hypothetical protein [Desulfobacteraceae bacterium]